MLAVRLRMFDDPRRTPTHSAFVFDVQPLQANVAAERANENPLRNSHLKYSLPGESPRGLPYSIFPFCSTTRGETNPRLVPSNLLILLKLKNYWEADVLPLNYARAAWRIADRPRASQCRIRRCGRRRKSAPLLHIAPGLTGRARGTRVVRDNGWAPVPEHRGAQLFSRQRPRFEDG